MSKISYPTNKKTAEESSGTLEIFSIGRMIKNMKQTDSEDKKN
jgi:hypothetical protein